MDCRNDNKYIHKQDKVLVVVLAHKCKVFVRKHHTVVVVVLVALAGVVVVVAVIVIVVVETVFGAKRSRRELRSPRQTKWQI